MRTHLTNWLLALAVALAVGACHRQEGAGTTALEKEFGLGASAQGKAKASPQDAASANVAIAASSGEAEVRRVAEQAVVAMRQHSYAAAVTNLQTLQAELKLTPQQRIAVHQAIESMQTELAQALSRGDAEAKRQADQLRQSLAH